MTDSLEESGGQLDCLSHDGMSERLWQRATEPAGVIDVRYAREKYFSIMRWLGERAALLDYLRSRYGIEETLVRGRHLFAAQDPSGRPVNIFSTTIQSFPPEAQAPTAATDVAPGRTGWYGQPSSLAEVLAAHSSKPGVELEASPETRFRIRRRPPAMSPLSGAPSPDRQPWTGSASQPATGKQVPDRTAAEFIFQKSLREGPEAQESVENKRTTVQQTPTGRTVTSEIPLIEPSPLPPSAAQHLAPSALALPPSAAQHLAPSALALAPSAALRLASPPSATPRLTAPHSPMAPSPTAHSPTAHSPMAPDRQVPIAQELNETEVLPLALAKAPAAPLNAESPLSSGRAQTARESPSAEMGPRIHTGSPSSHDPLPVVAPEIRDDSSNLPRPKIVWRLPPDGSRAAHFEAQVSGSTAQAVPVQFGHAASAPAAREGRQNAMPAPPQTQSEPALVEHLSPQTIRAISERVMRAITLDLKLERERRGIMKWR